MKPVFSIIIPLYNKAHTVSKAIKTVLAQTFSGFELIVVNDGSTDAGAEVIAGFSDERLVVLHQQNQGAAAARNLGIARAKGEYIAFLDADDDWEKDHLSSLLKLCRDFPDAGMCCMAYRKVYSGKVRKKAVFSGISEGFSGLVPDYFEACGSDSLASSSSVCVASKVFDDVSVFDPSIRSGQDTDMWIRIVLKYKVALHNKATANYNIHIEGSLSKSAFAADRLKLLSKFTAEEKNNASLKKYMDLNRYAQAIACTLSGEKELRKKALENIDYGNLNARQRLLLRAPGFALKLLKNIQLRFAKRHIFLSAFGG